MTAINTEYVHV